LNDAVEVVGFGIAAGAFDGDERQWTDFRDDEQDAREHVGADAGLATPTIPFVMFGDGGNFCVDCVEVGGWVLVRLVIAMEQSDGIGDAGNEGVDGKAISANVDAAAGSSEVFGDAVGAVVGERKLTDRDAQADVAQELERREAVVGDLVNVEGEFGLNVLMTPLGVVDDAAVFAGKGGEFNGDGEVCGLGVADGVADVVREGANGEGEFVWIFGEAEEVDDEISRTDVMGEIGEGLIAEWVIADVLNNAAAIGIGSGLFKIGGGEVGITAEEKGNDGIVPGKVDELLVREEGVGGERACGGEEQDEKKCGEDRRGETGHHGQC